MGRINSSQDGIIVSADGIAKTLMVGHCNIPKVMIKDSKDYSSDSMVAPPSVISYTRDRNGKIVNHHLKSEANTLHTGGGNTSQYVLDGIPYRVRSFTARECFRLMGVDDSDIDKIQSVGLAHTRQVALAGNSIVVDVLAEIFRTLFDENAPENNNDKPRQLSLFLTH
jgi:hypothetical protein